MIGVSWFFNGDICLWQSLYLPIRPVCHVNRIRFGLHGVMITGDGCSVKWRKTIVLKCECVYYYHLCSTRGQ